MRHCIACKSRLPDKELFQLQNAPASAQDIPDAGELREDCGINLNLYQCEHCGLVQFSCEPVAYYRDVIRAGGFSTTMTGLRRRQYRHLIETYHLEGKRFIEVGCGRGEFLKVLTEFPVEAYGMEHKTELVTLARESGLNVWQEFPETADQRFSGLEDGGRYDVFLSFNFLEHQPNPDVMLQAIWNNLADDGMGLVTVPSLEYILEKGSYYELIRDHLAYYSFGTLRGLLERNGFAVLEEEMINRDTISMIVKKITNPCGKSQTAPEHISVNSIKDGFSIVSREVCGLLARCRKEGKKLAVWGASHQGFTLAATTGIGKEASYIIDSAPFKQGRFAPASHLPIVEPEHFYREPVDKILIVAPGYTDEIAGIIRARFGEKPEVLTLRTNHIERLLTGKRVVVTGASGFIGKHVALELIKEGCEVFAPVRGLSRRRETLPSHERLHWLDIPLAQTERLAAEVGHADAFLHFAWGGVNREEIDSPAVQEENIAASLSCVRAAHELGCTLFMDAGSRVEYGITEDGVMEESMECHPVNEYGKAKLAFFRQAQPLCGQYGMTYYHLRFFSVYGAGDHPWSIISTLTRELPRGGTVSLSACEHRWNFMDIKDAARAVAELYRHSDEHSGECHIVNVASADTRVLKEFAEEIHDLCGGKGSLSYGSFAQAKEGALSICPAVERLSALTGGTWREQVTFAEGIRSILTEQSGGIR